MREYLNFGPGLELRCLQASMSWCWQAVFSLPERQILEFAGMEVDVITKGGKYNEKPTEEKSEGRERNDANNDWRPREGRRGLIKSPCGRWALGRRWACLSPNTRKGRPSDDPDEILDRKAGDWVYVTNSQPSWGVGWWGHMQEWRAYRWVWVCGRDRKVWK